MSYRPGQNIANVLSPDIAWKYRVVPADLSGNVLRLQMDEEYWSGGVAGELELITGYDVELTKHPSEYIAQKLSQLYRNEFKSKVTIQSADTTNTDDFLNRIIAEAKELKSSDIHIEAYAQKSRIRFRIDGKLIERYSLPKEEYNSFINKVKIKARLDIAEKRLPQDGRILISEAENRIDIRVSVLPSLYGEKVVLRLLSNDSSHIRIESLGMDDRQLLDFKRVIQKPNGIILISGPTGSGKTTTLYATLKLLNNESNNILTIEDPIEYTLDGINQVQLKESIGLTFSSALRTFLRQDPDIIMLGEIRDTETAQMAIRAALTGHLVLSTIHTNSAWGTVSRLVDMGIPTFLLASTLNATIAQRLIRKLCNSCKIKKDLSDVALYDDIKAELDGCEISYVPVGCNDCYYTGYAGRIAIYEIIPIDLEIASLIKANTHDISTLLNSRGITTLKRRVVELINNGETSVEEAYPILLNI
ncbi:MAG: general secretion pathway protein GspE [Bacteroidetes bacterium 43-93]|nr:type II/IV secretion system protein [Bacteroidota bacterium]OJX00710.1 MAG: general secretion pathway protein GspE [Bacteroidetes bacterium 43-93]